MYYNDKLSSLLEMGKQLNEYSFRMQWSSTMQDMIQKWSQKNSGNRILAWMRKQQQ